MWVYHQSNGWLDDANGDFIAKGYSGGGTGKNDPNSQNIPDVGPIPQGQYSISSPVDTVTHGPYVLALTPNDWNEMFGRSGFLIHGDSIIYPGTASKGCIILDHDTRVKIWESGDHALAVVV